MSGGSLDYFFSSLESHVGDFGDKELDELVKDLAQLFHDREWYLSGDTNRGYWVEARDNFKKTWFTEHGRQERIEAYLDAFRNEVLESFGMSDRYCKNCKHWKQDKREDYEMYGDCDLRKGCLWHRSESCEKYERGERHGTCEENT